MDYETIGKTEKTNILLQRLRQFEADHYNHGLNIALLEENQKDGDESDQSQQAIDQGKSAQRTIERAVVHLKAELARIGVKDLQKLLNPPTTPSAQEEPEGNRQTRRAAARRG